MLPPEFHQLLSEIKDHQIANSQPATVKERAKTVFFIALFLCWVLVFAAAWFYTELLPWITWLTSLFD